MTDIYRLRSRFANQENPNEILRKGAELQSRNSCHVGNLSALSLCTNGACQRNDTVQPFQKTDYKLFHYIFSYMPVRALECVAKPRNLPQVSASKFRHTIFL
jgi:hypothetical protein